MFRLQDSGHRKFGCYFGKQIFLYCTVLLVYNLYCFLADDDDYLNLLLSILHALMLQVVCSKEGYVLARLCIILP